LIQNMLLLETQAFAIAEKEKVDDDHQAAIDEDDGGEANAGESIQSISMLVEW